MWTLLGAPLDSAAAGLGEELAPAALRAAGLAARLGLDDAGDVTGRLTDRVRDPGTGVIAFAQLVEASAALRDAATRADGRVFVLGGDCSLLPGALAGARPDDLWMIDGHPDALDGTSSPTGEAADMDLAILTGHGPPDLTGLAGATPIVAPERVALVGHRPASVGQDVADELALVPAGVHQVLAPDVRARGGEEVAAGMLERTAGRRAWLHLDFDVLDETALPAVSYPQPEGLGWDDLHALLAPLLAAPSLAGVSIADFDAAHPEADAYAERIVAALERAWPQP
ncbi:MAG: arginase family protein [Solirubrobacteraceae bacterium]